MLRTILIRGAFIFTVYLKDSITNSNCRLGYQEKLLFIWKFFLQTVTGVTGIRESYCLFVDFFHKQ